MANYLRHLKAAAATPQSIAMLYLALFCLTMAELVALHVIPQGLRTRNHPRDDNDEGQA